MACYIAPIFVATSYRGKSSETIVQGDISFTTIAKGHFYLDRFLAHCKALYLFDLNKKPDIFRLTLICETKRNKTKQFPACTQVKEPAEQKLA